MASLQPHTGVLGHRLAAHLLRRCTFCYTKTRIDEFANKTAEEAVAELFDLTTPYIGEPIDLKTDEPWINAGVEPVSFRFLLRRYVISWWIDEAMRDTSIGHKLSFFLHSIFVVNVDFTFSREYYDYLALIKFHTLGSLKDLAKKMTMDQSMMYYLNGDKNTKASPNENYAREFFELFTIGKGAQIGDGNYTTYQEQDIVSAAKLLTGWRNTTRPLGGDPNYKDATTGIQQAYPHYPWHDTSDKEFSEAFDNQIISGAVDATDMERELNDFVTMIFNQEETARNYCRKIYRYFISPSITEEIEEDIITPLAQTLKDNDYQLQPTLEQLLTSEHFYDLDDLNSQDNIIGGLMKSPLETLLQTLTFFDITTPDPDSDTVNHYHYWYRETVLSIILDQAGMTIFKPESVAGYPAYFQAPGYSRNWFSGSTLISRYKLPEILISGNRVLSSGTNGGIILDMPIFIRDSGLVPNPEDGTVLVTALMNYLFPETPIAERFDYFLQEVFLDNLSLINWQFEWLNFIDTDDDSGVRIPLERLFLALISSQEFQLN